MSAERTIEQIISEDGRFVSTTSGMSMFPLFADRRDTIVVIPAQGRLKKYDVPLYRRGDDYVLHRIVKVLPDSYVICGDNCENYEYGITDDDIIGVLTSFYRKNKYGTTKNIFYRLYSFYIVNTHNARKLLRRVKGRIRRLFKK